MSLLHQIYEEKKYILNSYNIEGLINYSQVSRIAATESPHSQKIQ